MRFQINKLKKSKLAPLIYSLLSLLILALIYFPLYYNRMFNGLDGLDRYLLIQSEWKWMPLGLTPGINMLQGMGGAFTGTSPLLIPVYLLQLLLRHGALSHIATYTLFSFELFLMGYFWSRLFRLPNTIALLAGWLLTLLTLPFLPVVFLLNSTYQLVPIMINLGFYSTLFLICFDKMGRRSVKNTVLGFIGVILIPTYLSIVAQTGIILYLPTVFLVTLTLLIFAESAYERMCKFFALSLAVLFALALRVPEFLYNQTFFSILHYFYAEIPNVLKTLFNQSVLYQFTTFFSSKVLVPLSIIGAAVSLIKGNGKSRQFAILFLFLFSILIVTGILYVHLNWRGPSIDRFEVSLWPLYIGYSCYAVTKISKFIKQNISKIYPITLATALFITAKIFTTAKVIKFLLQRLFKILESIGAKSAFVMLITVIAINWIFKVPRLPSNYPPKSTTMVHYLQSRVALNPGSVFQGYVATFTPKTIPGKGIGWGQGQAGFDTLMIEKFGNDHRLVGLWNFNIPTLTEYNDYASPELYLLASRLLNRPIDIQTRNMITLTVPNFPLLQALGVRFIITNEPEKHIATVLRKKLYIDKKHGYLYLYELLNANIANYSPTASIKLTTAAQIINALKKGVNLHHYALMSTSLPSHLVPATHSQMITNKGYVTIKVKSKGRSTLLLPLSYTHCLKAYFSGKRPHGFKILRANLVETLLLFKGNLRVSISMPKNIVDYTRCKAMDMADAKRLQLKKASKIFPLIKSG